MTSTAEPHRGIPAIRTGRTLQSLRESGFSLPAALAELIDNAIEAGANNVVVDMREAPLRKNRKAIDRIAVADDGRGMSDVVLQAFPQLGYSSRYMRDDTVGKFGVGATLAGVTFGLRIDAWSRTSPDEPLLHVNLDVQEALAAEEAGKDVLIGWPDQAPPPDDLAALVPTSTGTLVVWSKIDRLADDSTARRTQELRDEVVRELSRMFREYLSGGIRIGLRQGGEVTNLTPWDPLMRMEGSRPDEILARAAARQHPEGPAAWAKDADRKTHFPATVVFDDDVPVSGSKIRIVVTAYPAEILRERGKGDDTLARQLHVHDRQGKVSFVRLGREINYAFVPQLLGNAVQERDRFIGIEVRFSPELDRMMGVRNVKRGAEPEGDLRQVIRSTLKANIPLARRLIADQWNQAGRKRDDREGEHSAINEAVGDAHRTMPKGRAHAGADSDLALEDLATDVGKTDAVGRAAYIERVRRLPFIVESVDWPGDQLFEIVHAGERTIVRLNTRHRFYRELYGPLRTLSQQDPATVLGEDAVGTARRAAEAITLLIIAYAKAESMHDDRETAYNELRTWWGNFTNTLLGKVKDVLD